MRSSIAEARQRLERNVVPIATDFQRREAERYLAKVEQKAAQAAQVRIDALAEQVEEMRTANLRALTEARDEADRIRADLSAGRIDPREATAALAAVRRDREGAEERLTKATQLIEQVEAIESDPSAWYDDLTRGKPRLVPEFPW